MRSVDSVWRSWKSLEFLDDIKVFESRYERSLRQAIKIKNKTKDRFVLFNLDSYIESIDKVNFLKSELFEKLELEIDESTAHLLKSLQNRNSIQKKGSSYVKNISINDEMIYLRKNKKIISYKNILMEDL